MSTNTRTIHVQKRTTTPNKSAQHERACTNQRGHKRHTKRIRHSPRRYESFSNLFRGHGRAPRPRNRPHPVQRKRNWNVRVQKIVRASRHHNSHSPKMSKENVVTALEEYADFLRIDGQNGRAHAYDKAARAIQQSNRIPPNPARLNNVGPSTREAIIDIQNGTGVKELETLKEKYTWYDELKDVNYIGPQRATKIHNTLNIETLEKLALVAKAGDLQLINGIGPKTAQKISTSIQKELNTNNE